MWGLPIRDAKSRPFASALPKQSIINLCNETKFVSATCIFRAFSRPKSVCRRGSAPDWGPVQEAHSCSRPLTSILGPRGTS